MYSFYFITFIFAQILIIVQQFFGSANAIRCFCTEEHCIPYGECEANVCLVGLTSGKVIRTCGNEQIGCQQNVGKWSDLCACESTFCNTFSFLRANTIQDRGRYNRDDTEDLVFQRIESSHNDLYEQQDSDVSNMPSKNSLLTLLLVIVPLSVGASTVLVVAFNYYCHLC